MIKVVSTDRQTHCAIFLAVRFGDVYEQNGSLKAVEITEKENADAEEDTVIKYYQVRKSVSAVKSPCRLAVKEYLEADEDGQAVVVYTRPFGLEAKAE